MKSTIFFAEFLKRIATVRNPFKSARSVYGEKDLAGLYRYAIRQIAMCGGKWLVHNIVDRGGMGSRPGRAEC